MFYLHLSKKSDITFSQTFKFVQRTITLGKDVTNNLRLYSPDESVSDIHAEIYSDMNNFFIIDRGSDTGTYIENMKLIPNRSYLLREGTKIHIGEYRLIFLLELPEGDIEKDEMLVENTISCMEDALSYMTKIREHNPDLYETCISKKLRGIFDLSEDGKFRSLLIQMVDPDYNMRIQNLKSNSNNSDFIVDMFLKLFIEFHSISIKISNEFIDSHTVHRRDSKQLLFPDSLKSYILDTKLSAEEKEKRIKFLWNEIEELISKHTALLAGYRNSIRYGIRDLLKELDPVSILNGEHRKSGQLKPLKIVNRYLSFLIRLRNTKRILGKYESLSKNIDKEIEQKYFHPAFKSGYLQKVNSIHHSEHYSTY